MKKCIAVLMMVVMLSGVAGLAEEFCIEDEVVIEEIEIGSDIEDILPELDVIVDAALLVTNDDFNEISNEQTFEGITSNVSDVAISEANFPDSAFRAYVQKNCDTNGDGLLSVNEAGAVTGMYLVNHGISSLSGIEHFYALERLDCSINELTDLEVSDCTALTDLDCSGNQLSSLDVRGCTALADLHCSSNQLSSLDVRGCTALTNFYCSSNKLSSLDVSGCTTLTMLDCTYNYLSSLDVSGCTSLTDLYCSNNQLSSLNVNNCTELKRIYFSDNELEELDVSVCVKLEVLECDSNRLKKLNVAECQALWSLSCEKNKLTELDLRKCASLVNINCSNNQLKRLNIEGCTATEVIFCNDNRLTSLDLRYCPALKQLMCDKNKLATLDVSNCPNLVDAIKDDFGVYTEDGTIGYGDAFFGSYVSCDCTVIIKPTPAVVHIAACTVKIGNQVYSGKKLKPKVTVKYKTEKLNQGTDYSVSYKNNKNIGVATATIKGKGRLTGCVTGTFTINPKAVSGIKLKAGSKEMTATWKKVSGVTGYQLEYSLKKDFSSSKTAAIAKAATEKKTIKNIKKGKTYYVRIRAYKKVNGKAYYSAWSAVKKVKIK